MTKLCTHLSTYFSVTLVSIQCIQQYLDQGSKYLEFYFLKIILEPKIEILCILGTQSYECIIQ